MAIEAGSKMHTPVVGGGTAPVKVLAVIYLAIGALGCLAAVVLCAGLWLSADPNSLLALVYVLPLACLVVLAFLLPQLAGGLGLLWQKRWAPGVAIAASVVYLFAFPFGTLLGVFGLWALLHGRNARGTGAAPAPPRSSGAGNDHRKLLLTMAGLAITIFAALAVALKTVPAMALNSVPRLPPRLPVVGGAILLLGIFVAATLAVRRGLHRRTLRRSLAAHAAHIKSRAAELRRDPATYPYAALIERGESWSDAQIAYDRDQGVLATCVHLQAAERAMRASGVALRLRWARQVDAKCRVARSRLERQCPPVPPAIYAEYDEPDRFGYGEPVAVLYCPACQSRIAVVHPDQATADTAWFPQWAF